MILQKISAVAIDDEPIALDVLKNHSLDVDFLDLRQCFVSVDDAMTYLNANLIDLVFLDINMPDHSGLDIAKLLGPKTSIVFTTAHTDYAIQGFELAVVDYLLKPIKFDRFLLACNRALAQIEIKKNQQPQSHIFIKSGYDLVRIELEELLFIRSADNYIVVYEGTKQHISRMTMTDVLEILPKKYFIRVHKSYIIAINKVKKIDTQKLYIGEQEIPISKTYKQATINVFNS